MTRFSTSADATVDQLRRRGAAAARSIVAKRTDAIVRSIKGQLDRVREEDPATPPAAQYGYGLVLMETDRVFREIDSSGRGHYVDVISADEIDGVFAYVIEAESIGVVFPGTFPGQILDGETERLGETPEDGTIFSGRFSGTGGDGKGKDNGTQIRLFTGTQQAPDDDLIAQTSLDPTFIGRGHAYVWSRFAFQEGLFNGDPSVSVIVRSRKVLDPRTAFASAEFSDQPKSFSINPYRFIFDYLIRPREIGGVGTDIDLVDIDSFVASTDWSEQLVDVIKFSKTALFSTRSNQQQGTPPIATNHLLEFEDTVTPFQFGDVVQINVDASLGQELPGNLSTGTDYYVIPVRHQLNNFQLPAIALAASLEDSLAGISIPQGTRTTDIIVTKVREIRFQSGAVYRAGEDVLERLLESCGAKLYLKAGKIAITRQSFPDEADIKRVDLDELNGRVSLSTSIDSDQRATALSGSFTSITNLFLTKNFPVVDGGGVFAAADGEVILRQFDLPFVSKASTAQRLATTELRKRRQELTVAFSGDLTLLRLRPDSVFSLDFPKYGLDEQTTFQVTDQTIFLRGTDDAPFVGVNIEARQLEASTFDPDLTNEEFVASAVIPGLESPFEVSPPGALQISEELFETRPGAGVRVQANITWPASTSPFVTRYEVSAKRSSSSTFFLVAAVPATETFAEVSDLRPGDYDFSVVAINSLGRRSIPSEVAGFRILGLSARPSTPTGFKGQVIGSATVLLRWDRSVDLDVREGGFIEIRHDPAINGAVAKDAIFIDGDVGGQTSLTVPFRQGTYWLRVEDSTGQFSDPVLWSTQDRRPVAVAQVPTGLGGALEDVAGGDPNIFTLQEDSTFPSSNIENTLIVVGGDHLELPLEDTLDDEADFDAIADVDAVGGGSVSEEGLYFFSTAVETDAPTRILVEAVIATEVFDLSASIDDEPDFDAIVDVDGVASALLQPGLATAEIQCRFSNGTIASDTFGPWETIDTQFINARSFEFRVLAKSFVSSVNIRVNQLRVRMRAAPEA